MIGAVHTDEMRSGGGPRAGREPGNPRLAAILFLVAALCGLGQIGGVRAEAPRTPHPAAFLPDARTTTAQANEFRVQVLDVDQGSATLIHTLDGKTILVDTGNEHAGPRLVQQLRAAGVTKIDHLVISHRHMDHVGGARMVAENFPVENIVTPWEESRIPASAIVWLATLRKDLGRRFGAANRPNFHTAIAGTTIDLGPGARMRVLWPNRPTGGLPIGDYNEESMVGVIEQDQPSGGAQTRVLTGGDLGWQLERHLAETVGDQLQADIVIGNHHGSKGSFDLRYLEEAAGFRSSLIDSIQPNANAPRNNVAARLRRLVTSRRSSSRMAQHIVEQVTAVRDGRAVERGALVHALADAVDRATPNNRRPLLIASMGRQNVYDHPSAVRMAAAVLAGFRVYNTDPQGTVVATRRVNARGRWASSVEMSRVANARLGLPDDVSELAPEFMRTRDPNEPYDLAAREANYGFEYGHPDRVIPWSSADEFLHLQRGGRLGAGTVSFLATIRQDRAGRRDHLRSWRPRILLGVRPPTPDPIWHGEPLFEAPWSQGASVAFVRDVPRLPGANQVAPVRATRRRAAPRAATPRVRNPSVPRRSK